MAGAAGRRYTLQPSFPVHDGTFESPQVVVSAEGTTAERIVTSSLWVQYIARLQADLSTAALNDAQKSFYSTTYVAEQRRYMAYITGDAVGVPPAVMASGGAPVTVKANLPEKFSGSTDKLELFLDNMTTYFNVTNTPEDKRAGVLRLNMSDSVIQTMTQTNRTVPNFWDDVNLITTTLKEFYSAPNKKTAAQTKLKHLKMLGCKLNKYFNLFVTLCGESGCNPDEQAQKSAFHLGLNNLVTRGGLRSQILHLVHDDDKTLKQLYLTADEFLQAEHGVSYETKNCPSECDEHRRQNNSNDTDRDAGWSTVNRKRKQSSAGAPNNGARTNPSRPSYNPRGNGGRNNANRGNNTGNANSSRSRSDGYSYNEKLACTRCGRKGHSMETCSAKYKGGTTIVLPYKTAAKVKDGTWPADGQYPERVAVNAINVQPAVIPQAAVQSSAVEPMQVQAESATPEVEECPALASNVAFGVQSAISLMDVDWCANRPKNKNSK